MGLGLLYDILVELDRPAIGHWFLSAFAEYHGSARG